MRFEKLSKMNANFLELEAAKRKKLDDMAFMLDIFDGQLSLADILNYDIPFLEGLRDARFRLIEQRRK